jgi:hypothetical protein
MASPIAALVNKTFEYTKDINPPFSPTRWVHNTAELGSLENKERMFFGTEPFSYGRNELRNPFYWEYED